MFERKEYEFATIGRDFDQEAAGKLMRVLLQETRYKENETVEFISESLVKKKKRSIPMIQVFHFLSNVFFSVEIDFQHEDLQ